MNVFRRVGTTLGALLLAIGLFSAVVQPASACAPPAYCWPGSFNYGTINPISVTSLDVQTATSNVYQSDSSLYEAKSWDKMAGVTVHSVTARYQASVANVYDQTSGNPIPYSPASFRSLTDLRASVGEVYHATHGDFTPKQLARAWVSCSGVIGTGHYGYLVIYEVSGQSQANAAAWMDGYDLLVNWNGDSAGTQAPATINPC